MAWIRACGSGNGKVIYLYKNGIVPIYPPTTSGKFLSYSDNVNGCIYAKAGNSNEKGYINFNSRPSISKAKKLYIRVKSGYSDWGQFNFQMMLSTGWKVSSLLYVTTPISISERIFEVDLSDVNEEPSLFQLVLSGGNNEYTEMYISDIWVVN